ncbi:MAG: hypothetical protein ACYDBB_06330 [Armatimonadota bacterium]
MTRIEKRLLYAKIDPYKGNSQDWRSGFTMLAFLVSAALWFFLVILLLMCAHFFLKYADFLFGCTPFVAFIAAIVFYVKVLSPWIPKSLIARSKYGRDYLAGKVLDYHYTATAALRVVESSEDFSDGILSLYKNILPGTREGFYLDIGDGDVLFLSGRYLKNVTSSETFPCREFVLNHLPHADETIGVDILDYQPLDPAQCHVLYNVKRDLIPRDFTEFTGDLRTIEERLRVS